MFSIHLLFNTIALYIARTYRVLYSFIHRLPWGWSGGAMVLGKFLLPGRPTIWITVRQGPQYCACSRCGRGLFGRFYSHLFFLSSYPPLFGRRPDIYGNTVSKGR